MSQLERLAEAIAGVGKQAGPVQQNIASAQRSGSQLAASVPNDEHGYSRKIRIQLYEGVAALRDAERLLADFDKQADAFAKRLANGGSVESPTSGTLGTRTLDSDDLAALADYTGSGYAEINRELRGGAVSAETRERADRVSAAIRKLPSYRGGVFRGATLSSDQIARYVPGQFRAEAAFTSTARDPTRAFGGNVLFLISSDSGKDVQGLSRNPAESEVLFDRDTTFYVHSNSYDPRRGKQVIVLMEVSHA